MDGHMAKRDDDIPDPCTEEARDQGCICQMGIANSASIDPPEPSRNKYCPLHGWAPDPDDERDRKRDDDAWFGRHFYLDDEDYD